MECYRQIKLFLFDDRRKVGFFYKFLQQKKGWKLK